MDVPALGRCRLHTRGTGLRTRARLAHWSGAFQLWDEQAVDEELDHADLQTIRVNTVVAGKGVMSNRSFANSEWRT